MRRGGRHARREKRKKLKRDGKEVVAEERRKEARKN